MEVNMSAVDKELLDYDYLLERAYSKLPRIVEAGKHRFEVPKAEVMVTGRKTFILNFKQICDIVNREPRVLLRFLLKELAAPGEIQENAAVIQGEFRIRTINVLIQRFVRDYVICPVCGSPDTILRKEKKVMFLKCMACGATSSVRPF